MFAFDAGNGLVVVFFVEFKADVVTVFFDTGDGGGAAAHAVVENYPPHRCRCG